MKRLAMIAVSKLALLDGPEPSAPGPNDVTLAIEGSGLGMTQLHILSGRTHRGPLPRVLGHEIVGRVTALGRDVPVSLAGARVVVSALIGCGRCRQCAAGQTSICPDRRYLGMDTDGGWTERIVVPAAEVLPIAAGVPLTDAVFLASAVPAAVHAVRRAGIEKGDRVAVIGLGTIGSLLGQAAKSVGAAQVVGVMSHDRTVPADGRPFDSSLVVSADRVASAAQLRDACSLPGGFDVVLEASGDVRNVELAIRSVRAGGTVLAMGLAAGPRDLHFDDYNADFALREISLRTTYASTRWDIATAIDGYARGDFRVSQLSGGIVRPADVATLVERLESSGTGGKRYAISFD